MTAQAPVYVIEDGVPIPDAYRPYLESPRAVAAARRVAPSLPGVQ